MFEQNYVISTYLRINIPGDIFINVFQMIGPMSRDVWQIFWSRTNNKLQGQDCDDYDSFVPFVWNSPDFSCEPHLSQGPLGPRPHSLAPVTPGLQTLSF